MITRRPLSLAFAFTIGCSRVGMATTTTPNTGDQHQGFLFSFPLPDLPSSLTLPLIQACPNSLTVSSLSTTNNPTPGTSDPIAPYTLVMLVHEQLVDGANKTYERTYSRSVNIGDMSEARSFATPWMNGTQLIACMWAANGVSGGCQDLMTVVEGPGSDDAFANSTSECRTSDSMGSWVTPPGNTLNAQVSGSSGNLASNGWPATCSDISVTPQNGTAPFTLLIAPAFHPPINITSNDMSPINYTVKFTHGQAFMLGLYDSAGNSFAYGPLHAGAAEDVTCLATLTGQTMGQVTGTQFGIGAFAGGVVGAFVLGAAGALVLACVLRRRQQRARKPSDFQILLDPYADPHPAATAVRRGSYHSTQSSNYPKPTDPFSPDPYDPKASVGSLYDPASYPVTPNEPGRAFRRPLSGGTAANPFERASSYTDESGSPDAKPRDSASYPGAGGMKRSDRYSKGESDIWMGDGSPRQGARSRAEEFEGRDRHRSISPQQQRNVYVVHSDGGGDVHIRLPEGGANVIELPPDYATHPPGATHSTLRRAPARARADSRASRSSAGRNERARADSGASRTSVVGGRSVVQEEAAVEEAESEFLSLGGHGVGSYRPRAPANRRFSRESM